MLQKAFASCGEVIACKVIVFGKGRSKGKSKGTGDALTSELPCFLPTGLVVFANAEAQQKAVETMNEACRGLVFCVLCSCRERREAVLGSQRIIVKKRAEEAFSTETDLSTLIFGGQARLQRIGGGRRQDHVGGGGR